MTIVAVPLDGPVDQEGGAQALHGGAGEADHGVDPGADGARGVVGVRVDHVQAARVANLVVDDDGLAVEAQVDALKAEEVQEPHGHGLGDFDPCIAERPAGVALEEGARAEVVDENAHAHAALMGLEERGGHLVGLAARMPDVELHVD